MKEEDFDELTSDSLKDYDVSSISGSEDEVDKLSSCHDDLHGESVQIIRKKLFIRLQTGERVSIWKCLLLNEAESVSYVNDKTFSIDNGSCLRESEMIERLKILIHEPRDNTHLRVVLLARGGHFAGCIFDGNLAVAHKTFHRSAHFWLLLFEHFISMGKKMELKNMIKPSYGTCSIILL